MAVTSWVSASSAASVTGTGTVAWTSPTNVHTDDTSRAEATSIPASGESNWLRAYFAFTSSDVPSGATIDGIEVEMIVYGSNTLLVRLKKARLVIGGTIGSTNMPSMPTTNWGTTGTIQEESLTLGGSSNLWSETPTQGNVTGASFGIAISAENYEASKNRNASVDYMRMRVYYTAATDTLGGASGSRRPMGVPWMRLWQPIPHFVRRNRILVPAWIGG